jgi:hypothetical protein
MRPKILASFSNSRLGQSLSEIQDAPRRVNDSWVMINLEWMGFISFWYPSCYNHSYEFISLGKEAV